MDAAVHDPTLSRFVDERVSWYRYLKPRQGEISMSKVIKAEYDEKLRVLRLAGPLDGVRDHELVFVTLETTAIDTQRPWLVLEGSLSLEAGESLAKAVEEMFPEGE